MTFTSSIFLIGILPWFICLYNLTGKKNITVRAMLLFAADTVLFIWSGAAMFVFLCLYAAAVWIMAVVLCRHRNRAVLAATIVLALIPLLLVKYAGFAVENLNRLPGVELSYNAVAAPLGISFFTFEAVSFLADIYKNRIEKTPNAVRVFLYLSFFPTVTSGPIIRYADFEEGLAIENRETDYTAAVERIIIGMCKKLLVADKLAMLADFYFDGIAAGRGLSGAGLWVGSIAYSLQLYFDFSGYSDMAVGIGKLIGFDIPENFDRPYQAGSISEFWKKWHISLTKWFKDYIYIPLGGNRCAVPRHILNMLIVWLLTGIWHGADWTFMVWGLGYFILLLAEKYIPAIKKLEGTAAGHIYTLFFVNLLWVPFRADNINNATAYLKGMFGGGSGLIEDKAVSFAPFLIAAAALCLPWEKWLKRFEDKRWFSILRKAAIVFAAVLAVCAMVNSAYVPYIYGKF